MTRESKLALIIGFSVFLVFGVLVGDYLSKARNQKLDPVLTASGILPEQGTNSTFVSEPVSRPLPPGDDHQLGMAPRPRIEEIISGQPEALIKVDHTDGPSILGSETSRTPLPVSTGKEKTYAVVSGDSLYKIAQREYADGSLHDRLAAYNKDKLKNGKDLSIGQSLRLPPKDVLLGKATLAVSEPAPSTTRVVNTSLTPGGKPEKPEAKPEATAPKTRTYAAKKGDTVVRIARTVLGSADRIKEIVKLNPELGPTGDNLREGQTIKLPEK